MKKWLLLYFLTLVSFCVLAQKPYTIAQIPNPKVQGKNYYVSNPDGILTNVSALNSLLTDLEAQTKIEFAIVVVKDFKAGEDEFNFALELFRKWGIGKKETNNGLLLFVATHRRKYRFITGYGLEGDLPDATVKQLASNYLVPYFKQQQYAEGVEQVTKAIIGVLEQKETTSAQAAEPVLGNDYTAEPNPDGGIYAPAENYPVHPLVNKKNEPDSLYYRFTHNYSLLSVLSIAVLALTIFSSIKLNKYSDRSYSISDQSRIRLSKKIVAGGCLTFMVFIIANFMIFSGTSNFFSRENLPKLLAVLYILMLIVIYSWYKKAMINLSARYFDDETYVQELKTLNKAFWWIFVANPLLLFSLLKQIRKQKQLKKRFEPVLDRSNQLMQRLNREKNIDGTPFINKGQHEEEILGVNDYDIWESTDKKEHKIIIWPEDNFADYDICPTCKFKTLSKPITITLREATYTRAGKAKQVLKCYNCSYEKLLKDIIIPIRVESSSSSGSSSSGSSSGSSSFGGGSSGGGGAGGSW